MGADSQRAAGGHRWGCLSCLIRSRWQPRLVSCLAASSVRLVTVCPVPKATMPENDGWGRTPTGESMVGKEAEARFGKPKSLSCASCRQGPLSQTQARLVLTAPGWGGGRADLAAGLRQLAGLPHAGPDPSMAGCDWTLPPVLLPGVPSLCWRMSGLGSVQSTERVPPRLSSPSSLREINDWGHPRAVTSLHLHTGLRRSLCPDRSHFEDGHSVQDPSPDRPPERLATVTHCAVFFIEFAKQRRIFKCLSTRCHPSGCSGHSCEDGTLPSPR